MNSEKQTSEPQVILPWHKQFWPWFLIILPGTVVISCIGLVILAFNKADQLIDENYYNNGLAINAVKHDIDAAKRLGINIEIDLEKTESRWKFTANYLATDMSHSPSFLLLSLEHPLEQSLDQTLLLRKEVNQQYSAFFDLKKQALNNSAAFQFNGKQFWYIDIQAADDHGRALQQWRLKGKFYSSDKNIILGND
jgi:hypothetical protein